MVARSHVVGRLAAGLLVLMASGPALATSGGVPKHMAPIPAATLSLMAAKDTGPAAPILIRTFKKEAELEVWKKTRGGRFVLLKTFPICRWSGQLGPKRKEGDRQTPEGFYAVTPAMMNPNSAHYLSFDTGFPNAFDRAQGATGSYLMVHGTCSSRGCFAMTDAAMGEIYALVREAFAGGQRALQFQGFPFRMTTANMVKHRSDPHIGFWRQLKEGADRFEATFEEPAVGVAAGRYTFRSAGPDGEAKASARRAEEEARIAALIEDGPAAIRTTYADGGQHSSFRALARSGAWLGEISRPETLAFAGREVIVTPARPKPKPTTQVAEAKAAKNWPTAPDLGAIQGALKPLPDEPSLFVFTALNQSSGAGEPPISGSLRIVPARLTEMAPFVFAPI